MELDKRIPRLVLDAEVERLKEEYKAYRNESEYIPDFLPNNTDNLSYLVKAFLSSNDIDKDTLQQGTFYRLEFDLGTKDNLIITGVEISSEVEEEGSEVDSNEETSSKLYGEKGLFAMPVLEEYTPNANSYIIPDFAQDIKDNFPLFQDAYIVRDNEPSFMFSNKLVQNKAILTPIYTYLLNIWAKFHTPESLARKYKLLEYKSVNIFPLILKTDKDLFYALDYIKNYSSAFLYTYSGLTQDSYIHPTMKQLYTTYIENKYSGKVSIFSTTQLTLGQQVDLRDRLRTLPVTLSDYRFQLENTGSYTGYLPNAKTSQLFQGKTQVKSYIHSTRNIYGNSKEKALEDEWITLCREKTLDKNSLDKLFNIAKELGLNPPSNSSKEKLCNLIEKQYEAEFGERARQIIKGTNAFASKPDIRIEEEKKYLPDVKPYVDLILALYDVIGDEDMHDLPNVYQDRSLIEIIGDIPDLSSLLTEELKSDENITILHAAIYKWMNIQSNSYYKELDRLDKLVVDNIVKALHKARPDVKPNLNYTDEELAQIVIDQLIKPTEEGLLPSYKENRRVKVPGISASNLRALIPAYALYYGKITPEQIIGSSNKRKLAERIAKIIVTKLGVYSDKRLRSLKAELSNHEREIIDTIISVLKQKGTNITTGEFLSAFETIRHTKLKHGIKVSIKDIYRYISGKDINTKDRLALKLIPYVEKGIQDSIEENSDVLPNPTKSSRKNSPNNTNA